ncbi:MAG: carboxylesterase [Rhodanobacter denitrificans]|uniref:Carboxylesterase n=1 Tax=Rhodanobacter denitrificans TaxID=666685 RepID=A0A2W5KGW9_9GAMM|nr:MAG: carboxylesterase [Rhodanobacter denitrificans]
MPLPTVDIETAPQPRHAVIWLHGLGADGHDFEPIVPELVARDWPPLRFVFPHAPVRPVTINGGMPMRAWYDIVGTAIADRQDEPGLRASFAELDALIEREVERGIAPSSILLAGFSQGAAVALAGGLRQRRRLAGIIGLSGYLPLQARLPDEAAADNRATPIFLAHGSADPIVPEGLGTMSRDFLRQHGYTVDWHSYPMAHQVCAEEIADLRSWIGRRLAA